jgi:hypothetical protein
MAITTYIQILLNLKADWIIIANVTKFLILYGNSVSKNRDFLKYFVSDQISPVSSSYFHILHPTQISFSLLFLEGDCSLSLHLDVSNANQIVSSITVALVSKSSFIE